MNNKIDIKSMAVGAFLGAVIVFSVAAGTTGDSTVWEYKTLQTYASGDLDKQLNDLGREGWDVVSSSTTHGSSTVSPYAVVIFKRAKR